MIVADLRSSVRSSRSSSAGCRRSRRGGPERRGLHEDRGAPHLRSRATRRPRFGGRYFVFLTLTTDDGIKGVGEVYAATFHPRALERMIEDVFERHVAGADPFAIEMLGARIGARLLGAARPLAHRRAERNRDGVLGHRRQGGRQAGRRASRRTGARAASCVHLSLYESRTTRGRLHGSGPRGRACRCVRGRGFTALKFDPLGPYSAFDPRQPSLEALDAHGDVRRARPRGRGDTCDLLVGTHGQLTPAARFASRAGSSASIRSGSRSRYRPRARSRWPRWRVRRRSRSRPASA